jgi:hypothetical protein
VSQGLQWYLHGQKFYDQASVIDPLPFLYFFLGNELIPLFFVLLGGLLMTAAVPLALAMRLGSWHVARDVYRYLLRIEASLVVTFSVYSLALFAVNLLVPQLLGCNPFSADGGPGFCHDSRYHPFYPGILTGVAMLVVTLPFILSAPRSLARRRT